jgi:hypothetical protein
MGLKDRIAGSILGPYTYGKVLGRNTVIEGGSGLANIAFFNHGYRAKQSGLLAQWELFDTVSDMEAAGFKHRYDESFKIVGAQLPADELILYKNLHRDMIPVAYLLVSTVASSIMQTANSAKFCGGMSRAVSKAMTNSGLYAHREEATEALAAHVRLHGPTSSLAVIDLAKPADGDFLEFSLVRCAEISETQSQYAFTRTGACRLRSLADTLFAETFRCIFEAKNKFGW